MPIAIFLNGTNNSVRVDDEVIKNGHGTIRVNGDNTSVVIGPGCVLNNCDVSLSGNSKLTVGIRCFFNSIFVYGTTSTEFRIGNSVSFNARVRLLAHEPSIIQIGDGCLLASDIDVSTSDMHSIFDETTKERINPAANVRIGNSVWIGDRVLVLKGSTIGDGGIIGSGSIVSGELPGRSISVGAPARAVRSGVIWNEQLLETLPEIFFD